jgi:hypothetical protein
MTDPHEPGEHILRSYRMKMTFKMFIAIAIMSKTYWTLT